MRPPHYAGENSRHENPDVAARLASMRPPHYAGENWNGKVVAFTPDVLQ